MRFCDANGRMLQVISERLVSQDTRHLVALRTTFQAEDWSGPLRVRSSLDGGVVNGNVAALAPLANRHLRTVRTDVIAADTVMLEVVTTQSQITIAMAARTRAYVENGAIAPPTRWRSRTKSGWSWSLN